jgi:hypothetical protein
VFNTGAPDGARQPREPANETNQQHWNVVVGHLADRDGTDTAAQSQLLGIGHRHGASRARGRGAYSLRQIAGRRGGARWSGATMFGIGQPNSAAHREPLKRRTLWHSSSRRPRGRER